MHISNITELEQVDRGDYIGEAGNDEYITSKYKILLKDSSLEDLI